MKSNITNNRALKKTLLLGFAIIIFCCALALISFHSSSVALHQNICESYEKRAVDDSELLSQVLNEKLLALKLVAEDYEIRSMNWKMQKGDLMSHVNTLDIKRFKVIDRNGVSRSTDGITEDVSYRDYYKKALQGVPNVSDLLRSTIDDSLVICCSVPIRDKNSNILGVLSYTLDYQVLNKLIEGIKVGQKGYAFMINSAGTLIAHPDKTKILSEETVLKKSVINPSLEELANIERRMVKGETGYGFYNYGGSKRFVAYTPVEGTDWSLALSIPNDEVFSKIDSLKSKFILETILFIIIALLLCYLILINSSQRKKAEDLQRDATKSHQHLEEVTELDKLKTEFFINITHEFRTPINVIFGALQLFEYSINNKTGQSIEVFNKRIKIMKQNCFRLLRLINNLIDTTKIDTGYFEVNLKNDDLVRVVEEITLSVADYIEGKGIELVFDTEVEQKIMAIDHDKIEKILMNLLSNATKFTNDGGRIMVNIFDRGEKIEVSVKDTGIGIPEDKQDVIFERFRQVDKSLARSHEGSGIGLSLTKSLVEMLGGKISLRSEYGKGSEFVVELPVSVLNNESDCKDSSAGLGKDNYVDKINVEFSDIYF
jgi:signal transduction histidine kinase